MGVPQTLILARCLGGGITLDSRPGKGATFRLALPVKMAGEWTKSEVGPVVIQNGCDYAAASMRNAEF